MPEQLDRDAVSRRCGIDIKTVDTYRRRGILPHPDGRVGRSPWWSSDTIDAWQAERRKWVKTAERATAGT